MQQIDKQGHTSNMAICKDIYTYESHINAVSISSLVRKATWPTRKFEVGATQGLLNSGTSNGSLCNAILYLSCDTFCAKYRS